MKKGMLDTLANVAANLESFDGVFVITIQKGVDQNDDDIGFAASGDTLSYLESIGLSTLFARFIEADAALRQAEQREDDEDDEDE